MDGQLGTVFSQPDQGRTDQEGRKEFIIKGKMGSKGAVYYTRRLNHAFREPDPIAPTAKIESYQQLVNDLRLARLEERLSQVQLAKVIGSNQAAVSRFEQGKTNPTVTFLHAYAKALSRDIKFNV